ncbi:MAG: hypothetical protein PHU63_00890 [Candidatus ainarchaeum sp.]|nr:hypothetical protein [Candidatus ainarchaeum sp.]
MGKILRASIRTSATQRKPILGRAYECLNGRLGENRFYRSGSTTHVHSSELTTPDGVRKVVLKFWIQDMIVDGETAFRVHNNYVALNEMQRRGDFEYVRIPEFHYSIVELNDGTVFVLPVDLYVGERTIDLAKNSRLLGFLQNQMVVVDDLSEGNRFDVEDAVRYFDRSVGNPICYKEVQGDILRIASFMPKEESMLSNNKCCLEEGLFLIVEPNTRQVISVALGDIDKIPRIDVPGIESFELGI